WDLWQKEMDQVLWEIVSIGFCPPLHAQTHTHKHCLTTVVCMIAGKKLRLFHFLFEMLEDPGMAHCVSWVSASVGVFRFSARHKERVAELWGQRKGNRMPMTYQKMSRALRNYAHSGEIIKVKKKLTYQFSGHYLRVKLVSIFSCSMKVMNCGVLYSRLLSK
uniref:Transcription factor Spi-C n=1 Tax=Cyprinus carpio TaxID=7962 RepID=A0A8C2GMP1_CYPCA